MATVLLPPFAKMMFVLSLSGYLFGDLSIYYKAIGASLVDFTWYIVFVTIFFLYYIAIN